MEKRVEGSFSPRFRYNDRAKNRSQNGTLTGLVRHTEPRSPGVTTTAAEDSAAIRNRGHEFIHDPVCKTNGLKIKHASIARHIILWLQPDFQVFWRLKQGLKFPRHALFLDYIALRSPNPGRNRPHA